MSQAQLLPTEHFSPSVSLHDGRPATTSLEVAKFFSKRHDHVLRDIDTLLSQLPENSLQPNFGEMFQEQETPLGLKQIRIFILYRDGFMLLVMGYTGKKALAVKLAYIEAFNRLEAELAAQRGSALPSSDTLTPEQQAQLQAIVAAKAGMVPASHRRRAFQEIWARFNNNFQIARYAQLPPARIGEAVEYLVSMEVKAAKALPPTDKESLTVATSTALAFRADFPDDMGRDRREAMQRIERIARDMHTSFTVVRNIVRLGCHPGSKTMRMSLDEREAYETLHNLYTAADESLCAAYNALDAGYKLGRLHGRG